MGIFNKSENWWLRLTIVIIVLSSLTLLASINRETTAKIEYQQNQIDSLNTEIFNQSNMVGRYELTIDHFIELKKLDSTEVNEYLNHETE